MGTEPGTTAASTALYNSPMTEGRGSPVIGSALLRGTTHPHPTRRHHRRRRRDLRVLATRGPRSRRAAGIRTAIEHLITFVKTHDPLSPSKTPRWSDCDTPR